MGFFVCSRIRFLVALSIFAFASARVQAALVTYTLEVQQLTGEWQLFGEASLGDNAGLVLVSVPLMNVNFPVDLQLPKGRWGAPINLDAQAFIVNRVANVSPVGGSQDVIGGTGIVYGFGQEAGSLTIGNEFVQQNYDAKLLIARGTFNLAGPLPQFGAGGSANVFMSRSGTTVFAAELQKVTMYTIPEPATCTYLALAIGSWSVIRARRRQAMTRIPS